MRVTGYCHWLPIASNFMELSPAIIIAPIIHRNYCNYCYFIILLKSDINYILEEKIELI